MNDYVIENGNLILSDRILRGHSLVVAQGRIRDITTDLAPFRNYETIDAEGGYVSPGFVEIHIHGCGGHSFEEVSENTLPEIHASLYQRGVNTYLPTLQCSEAAIQSLVAAIQAHPEVQYSIPGIYIEGPFINPEKKGGILERFTRAPDVSYMRHLFELCRGLLKIMTFAPELHGIEEIHAYLVEHNIIPAMGHSNGTLAHARRFADQHPAHMTHLFNAMSPVSHQRPGLAMLPFLHREVFYELIGDGIHVAEDCLNLCYQTLRHERCILITDATAPAGLPYGEYCYYDQAVRSSARGVRYAASETLVGSNALIHQVVKYFATKTCCPLPQAIQFVTLNPAALLGLDHEQGSIAIGKKADLIILDRDLNCIRNLNPPPLNS